MAVCMAMLNVHNRSSCSSVAQTLQSEDSLACSLTASHLHVLSVQSLLNKLDELLSRPAAKHATPPQIPAPATEEAAAEAAPDSPSATSISARVTDPDDAPSGTEQPAADSPSQADDREAAAESQPAPAEAQQNGQAAPADPGHTVPMRASNGHLEPLPSPAAPAEPGFKALHNDTANSVPAWPAACTHLFSRCSWAPLCRATVASCGTM